MIRQLCYNQPHVKILDLYLLQSWHHTRHGLHINRTGKKFISGEVINLTSEFFQNTASNSKTVLATPVSPSTSEIQSPTENASTKDVPSGIQCSTEKEVNSKSIQVVEGSMETFITQYLNSPSVAFSHCISGDFNNKRRMSKGVAVIFRNKFGRPKPANRLNNFLTMQRVPNGALVYGLVTKNKYSNKPEVPDYISAIDELIKDFKNQHLKELICSTMGCVRDQITLPIFSQNIVKFHYGTGATVKIIVEDERASRNLRNGLKFHDFVTQLRSSIADELSRSGPPDPASKGVLSTAIQRDNDVPAPEEDEKSSEISDSEVWSVSLQDVLPQVFPSLNNTLGSTLNSPRLVGNGNTWTDLN
uniref:Uncharacterized protein n=1 Tax=Graphocephala atropunctata TaxID=36148 RepID=A0A1B6KDU3_9HEMI